MTQPGWRAVGGESFSVAQSIGGLRGFLESSAPGVVFVIAYLVWGGFRIPTIAAVATVAVLVGLRLVQRTPILHALSGVFGVALGAVWAWRFADPGEYFVPGFWANGVTLAVLLLSIVIGWPLVGVAVAAVRGASFAWRRDVRARRRFAAATLVMAALFALKLVVQLPLYWSGNVAALGVAKVAMGLPLFALTAWLAWLIVRGVSLPHQSEETEIPSP